MVNGEFIYYPFWIASDKVGAIIDRQLISNVVSRDVSSRSNFFS